MNVEYRILKIEVKKTNIELHIAGLLLFLIICLFPCQASAAPTCITAGCHSELQEDFPVHPEEFSCTDCHKGDFDNHDQLEVRLTFASEMCVKCHEEEVKHIIPHAPVAEGDCKSCHDPHISMGTALLRNDYPQQFYVDYTKGTYALCFNCHKPELLMYPETAFSTGFRNGIRNLHYLHVNREKRGRNCNVCHGVHGSEKPKLMADTSRFGNWQLQINFQISEQGGSCAPGCHRPRKYDRKDHE